MTVTVRHRTGAEIVKKFVTKYTQDEDYITLYFDNRIYPTMRYVKLPVTAYGVRCYEVVRVDA